MITKSDRPDVTIQSLTNDYQERLVMPYVAGAPGNIDNVIAPGIRRPEVTRVLRMLGNDTDSTRPRKKCGDIPL